MTFEFRQIIEEIQMKKHQTHSAANQWLKCVLVKCKQLSVFIEAKRWYDEDLQDMAAQFEDAI